MFTLAFQLLKDGRWQLSGGRGNYLEIVSVYQDWGRNEFSSSSHYRRRVWYNYGEPDAKIILDSRPDNSQSD